MPYSDKSKQKAYLEKWRLENRDRYIDSIKKSVVERRVKHTIKLIDLLSTLCCVDCGESDIRVLDFDHVRGKKSTEISTAIRNGWSWVRIEKEMKKCDVRCANCHRKRTADMLWKYKVRAPVVERT